MQLKQLKYHSRESDRRLVNWCSRSLHNTRQHWELYGWKIPVLMEKFLNTCATSMPPLRFNVNSLTDIVYVAPTSTNQHQHCIFICIAMNGWPFKFTIDCSKGAIVQVKNVQKITIDTHQTHLPLSFAPFLFTHIAIKSAINTIL